MILAIFLDLHREKWNTRDGKNFLISLKIPSLLVMPRGYDDGAWTAWIKSLTSVKLTPRKPARPEEPAAPNGSSIIVGKFKEFVIDTTFVYVDMLLPLENGAQYAKTLLKWIKDMWSRVQGLLGGQGRDSGRIAMKNRISETEQRLTLSAGTGQISMR